MKTTEAEKLNLDIQEIYEKPSFGMTFEQQDEAVIKLIQKRFNTHTEQVVKEACREIWSEIRRDWKCEKKFDEWYKEWKNSKT